MLDSRDSGRDPFAANRPSASNSVSGQDVSNGVDTRAARFAVPLLFSSAPTQFAGRKSGDLDELDFELPAPPPAASGAAMIFFQAPPQPVRADDSDDDDAGSGGAVRSSRLNRRGRRQELDGEDEPVSAVSAVEGDEEDEDEAQVSNLRRRRRRRSSEDESEEPTSTSSDEVTGVKGSTRLEAKRQRRRETRKESRKRAIVTESEFLARRESVKREMIVREKDGLNQIAVLEDGLLVEHYVARRTQQTMVGNIYLGRVQNVLPSMEAAFVDLGKGRNAVLYAGEVNWEAVGITGSSPRRIEKALKSGDTVLVQVTKDPIGHKGARLTAQITLAGRFLVLVPGSSSTGISRKLPQKERGRLKKLLGRIVPKDAGVIVRTAAEGASEEQLRDDVSRLVEQWEQIKRKQKGQAKAPLLLRSEPELAVRVVRDVFNEDFASLTVQGKQAWETIHSYVCELSPDLEQRLTKWVKTEDVFAAHRVDEQLTKGMDRKVWLPSGGSLIIDRTEAMTVIDVNTGKFIGAGGTLEETVTKNNLEAAEEIVRQLRLRDIGGIVVIDFVDMVLESNRDLVLRRLVECLGRDRTRHQVTEVTSLGLVQMTRKRVGEGLVEAFSTPCECCEGRGFILHSDPVERSGGEGRGAKKVSKQSESSKSGSSVQHSRLEDDECVGEDASDSEEVSQAQREAEAKAAKRRAKTRSAMNLIAAATVSAHQGDMPVGEVVSVSSPTVPEAENDGGTVGAGIEQSGSQSGSVSVKRPRRSRRVVMSDPVDPAVVNPTDGEGIN